MLESNPLRFLFNNELNSSSSLPLNPNSNNDDDKLLLLLFSKNRLLLLFFPLKASNPLNKLYSMMSKYKNAPFLIFSILVILFY